MGQPDFLVVGHVSKDLTNGGHRAGGTVVYSALTARNLGRRVAVVTSAGRDLNLGQFLEGVELVCVPSPVTTTFRNVYTEGARRQRLYAVAERIKTEDVPLAWRTAPIVLLGPIVGELEGDMIDQFPSSLLGVTPQGWLREWGEEGSVLPRRWSDADRLLTHLDVLIVSEEDLAGEAGTLRPKLGIPKISVLTQGAKGATLYCHGRRSHFPVRQTTALDPTGAGDIFAAAFLVRLAETDDPVEATRFANVAASLSVEKAGLSSVPTRAEIEATMTNRR